MTHRMKTVRTTIIGGLVFLVPFGILLVVFGKVFEIMGRIAAPISRWIPVDHVGHIAVVDLIAALLIVLVCFLAGLLATRGPARKIYARLDETLLNVFPRYTFVKAFAQQLDSRENASSTLIPVLVRFDDFDQVAFEVERDPERVVLYVPGSPDPWSGTVAIVTPERVHPMNREFTHVLKTVRLTGRGTTAMLTGADRRPRAG